jgi:hypothetical protein
MQHSLGHLQPGRRSLPPQLTAATSAIHAPGTPGSYVKHFRYVAKPCHLVTSAAHQVYHSYICRELVS